MITENIAQNVEKEYQQIEKDGGWNCFYQGIRSDCLHNHRYSSAEARKDENKNLNRYRDVSPFDHSRVILSKGACDYINASLIRMDKANRKYILTQGPLPHTTSHFWLMIWEQRCSAIIMLNRVIEKNVIKCHQYWPLVCSDVDTALVFNDVGLKVIHVSETKASYYTTTKLRLIDLSTDESREVLHFHYTTWPDFGVPQSPTAFLRFLTVVRNSGALDENVGPPVVHCSAGIGRSGTFCLVDSCLVLIQDMMQYNTVVREVLMEMRKYRMGLIQTPDQLRFSYLAIIEGLKKVDLLNGTVEENCENEEENEEEPPPLPPPRGESLTRSRSNYKNKSNVSLPNEIPVSATDLICSNISSSSSQNDINDDGKKREETTTTRQRRKEREERNAKLEKKVEEIKRKLKGAESWQRVKNSLLHPWSLGCIIIGGGIIAYSFFTIRG